MEAKYRTTAVMNLIGQWAGGGFSARWDRLPIVADLLEEAGLESSSYILRELREGNLRESTIDYFRESQLPIEIVGYDWQNAFEYAGGEGSGNGEPNVKAVPSEPQTSADLFTRWDVAELISASDGENDERNWVCCGRLKDGRYFFLDAGCDYTGWDCQASGTTHVATTLAAIIREGMGPEDRVRLGCEIL